MGEELAIYFAGAVRAGGSHEQLATKIEVLSTLGHVVNEHMASRRTLDIGDDLALLGRAHVLIADVSTPSTSTGYMIARAVARDLPVLALYAQGQVPSAVIAGAPGVTTMFFADDADFLRHVRAFLLAHAAELPPTRGQRIFLAGPPGAGKGTLGRWLAEAIGAPHISMDDLSAGEQLPPKVMRERVVERLGRPDCRLFGMVLDGYPPSLDDLDNLTAHGITPDLVLLLECSDATSIARQLGRGPRTKEAEEHARRRLGAYHDKMPGFEVLATRWYPDSLIARVDAEQPPEQVAAFALQTVRNALHRRRHPRSYVPIPPARAAELPTTRLHFRVDAPSAADIHAFATALLRRHKHAQGRVHVHPIEALALGPQHGRLPIYPQLASFHPIDHADDEASITGRLGDGDRALMTAVLDLGRERHAMVGLEEYVGEWILRADGELVEDSRYTLLAGGHAYPEHVERMCKDLPLWELRHGFDLAKHGEETPPWPLADLVATCARAGFDNGGWFVFKHDHHWAYRSNEFSSESEATARARLLVQLRELRALLAARGHAVDISCSLERVHGIWAG